MKILSSISTYLIRFFYLHLFITLASLPIIINWGLPLSIMSPIANLIFTPFLMAFLLIASLLFFFQLVHLPNDWLAYLLEKVVQVWTYVLKFHSSSWLISFAKPSCVVFILMLIATFFVLHCKKIPTKKQSLFYFSLLLLVTCSYLFAQRSSTNILQLECNNGPITVLKKNNQLILIDPGVLGRRTSTPSWIEYTLLPKLNKIFGSFTIDHVIVMQPSILTFEAIYALCRYLEVKNIYLVTWQGSAPKSFYRDYGQLKKIVSEKNIKLHHIGSWKKTIVFGNGILDIIPYEKKLAYNEISFPALQVRTEIDNKEINIYSAKYKKENHG